MTITGTSFVNVTAVSVGGLPLQNLSVAGSTQITGQTPASASRGIKDVVVTSSSHGSGTCTGCFVYDPVVTVTSVSPNGGPLAGGTAVTITGTNFPSAVDSVRVGTGRLGNLVRASATQLTGATPASGTAGAVDVSVFTTGAGSGTCSACFTYLETPSPFNLSRELFGTPRTLGAYVQSTNPATRQVTIGGVDTRGPNTPFTFDWGDGNVTSGWFDQSHVYASASRNYVVRVTAHYSAGGTDYMDVAVRFVAPLIAPVSYPAALAVTIPAQLPVLVSRQAGYAPPAGLVAFDDSYFGAALPRADVEYVLSQAAVVEAAILENDVENVGGGFDQVVLRDPSNGGAYSIWYTTPVAFGANGSYFQGTPGYSSLFHEMGHNFSLNAPAAFRFGGRIDGNANAIFSEAVAQMFQHAVAFELVNNAARYGLPDDLALDIANSARSSVQIVRAAYDAYVAQGMPFSTWNDADTPSDETFGTFMTVARQFLAHAEWAQSYVVPLTRTMRLLRTFDDSLAARYAPYTNSVAASTFRATLMVAALSYGFRQDLRAEFRALNFPIDDATYTSLYGSIP